MRRAKSDATKRSTPRRRPPRIERSEADVELEKRRSRVRRELGSAVFDARAALFTWERLCHHLVERLAERIADTRRQLDRNADQEDVDNDGNSHVWANRADSWCPVTIALEASNRIRLYCSYGDFPNEGEAEILFGLSDDWRISSKVTGVRGKSSLLVRIAESASEAEDVADRAARSALALLWPFCDPLFA